MSSDRVEPIVEDTATEAGRGETVVATQRARRRPDGSLEKPRIYPTLVVLEGPNVGGCHTLSRPVTSIGRSEECEIVTPDSQVSRRHASVVYENFADMGAAPVCHVRDEGSTNGTYYGGERIAVQPLRDHDRFSVGRTVFGYFLKDTLELDADARLLRRATTDALTGLGNRRLFDSSLGSEFSRARRYGRALSLVILDIDHFKSINDTYGHPGGDAALKLLGRLIMSHIREQDTAYRYGGEEIAILAPEVEAAGAQFMAERLRAVIERSSLKHQGRTIAFTASFGVAAWTEDMPDARALVAAADAALYRAKDTGRNRVAVAS